MIWRRWWVVLAVVWTASAAYAGARLERGWVPHDEGTLGQAAERVNQGELPHRDFVDPYTGALNYVNAAAFRVLGTDLRAPRLVLFTAFLLWIPAVFYVAHRFVGPLGAGGVTLLAAAWSIPNYPAAMPSWYNLFFAVFGIVCLLRFLDSRRRRWLFAAGVCGGLSIMVKIVGLYFVAGALLSLAFFEQEDDLASMGAPAGSPAYRAVLLAGLAAFAALVVFVVRSQLGTVALVHLVLPPLAAGGAVAWNELRASMPRPAALARFKALWRMAGPFLAGVLAPVILFMVPYLATGAVGDLVRGVLVVPFRRSEFAAVAAPSLATLAWGAPFGGLLSLALFGKQRIPAWVGALVGVLLLVVLLQVRRHDVYRDVWYAMRPMLPLTLLAAVPLVLRRQGGASSAGRSAAFAVLAVAAVFALIQYPFAAPIYFIYTVPLVVLAATAVLSQVRERLAPLLIPVAMFFALFALRWVHPGFIYLMEHHFGRVRFEARLDLPRGGVRVTPEDKSLYQPLVAAIQAHAGSAGAAIYAAPDCPEVYFLSATRNPTRDLFEFLGDAPGGGSPDSLAALLRREQVRVVVVNTRPDFSPPLSEPVLAELARLYPRIESFGKFDVRWRE
jgi:hypothetical protein